MRTVCLINNYNYSAYLHECLQSVERQSRRFDRVIVVDDGSTDDSRSIIESFCDRLDGWEALCKPNGGQLSCFNACLHHVERDDVVTFLDADDVYPVDYLELLMARVHQRPADFYFGEYVFFRHGVERPIDTACKEDAADVLIPCSSSLSRRFRAWMGSPTSAIAVSGRLMHELLPYPHERDWITRADDVLVIGASLLGVAKLYMPGVRVAYRVHGANGYHGRKYDEAYRVQREHRLQKLFGWYCHKQLIPLRTSAMVAAREHALIPDRYLSRFGLEPREIRGLLPFRVRLSLWNMRRKQAKGV